MVLSSPCGRLSLVACCVIVHYACPALGGGGAASSGGTPPPQPRDCAAEWEQQFKDDSTLRCPNSFEHSISPTITHLDIGGICATVQKLYCKCKGQTCPGADCEEVSVETDSVGMGKVTTQKMAAKALFHAFLHKAATSAQQKEAAEAFKPEYNKFLVTRAAEFSCAKNASGASNAATSGANHGANCKIPRPFGNHPQTPEIEGTERWDDCSNSNPLVQDWWVKNPMGVVFQGRSNGLRTLLNDQENATRLKDSIHAQVGSTVNIRVYPNPLKISSSDPKSQYGYVVRVGMPTSDTSRRSRKLLGGAANPEDFSSISNSWSASAASECDMYYVCLITVKNTPGIENCVNNPDRGGQTCEPLILASVLDCTNTINCGKTIHSLNATIQRQAEHNTNSKHSHMYKRPGKGLDNENCRALDTKVRQGISEFRFQLAKELL